MKKNWYKGLTATAISLAMAGAAVSVPAFAIEYDLANGDVNVGVNAETGSVESWQTTNGTDEFYYALNSETGAWDTKTTGRYQHTQTVTVIDEETKTETVVKKTDNDVIITQSSPETATDNTVTVSGDLKGDDTTAADDVDITIKDVNVDTSDDFIDIAGGTTAEITIEHSTVESDKSIVDIGTGSDITLNLNGENIPNEDGTTGEDKDDPNPDGIVAEMALREGTATIDGSNNFTSYNGITTDNSNLTINHDGVNTFTGSEELAKYAKNENYRFEYAGINIKNGGTVSILGHDETAELTITGYLNGIGVNSEKAGDEKTTLNIQTGTVNLTESLGGISDTGSGIFIGHGSDDVDINITSEDAPTVNEDNSKNYLTHVHVDHNDNNGIYYPANSGSHIYNLNVTNSELTVFDNGYVGINQELKNASVRMDFNNSRVHINENKSNGITGQENTYLYVHDGSEVQVNGNAGLGMNNTNAFVIGNIDPKTGKSDTSISVSNNGAHGLSNGSFDIFNAIGDFSGNGGRGLNVSKVNTFADLQDIDQYKGLAFASDDLYTHIYNSEITANGNTFKYGAGGIVFQRDTLINGNSVITANDNIYGTTGGDGIQFLRKLIIDHGTIIAMGNGRDGINGFNPSGNAHVDHPVIIGNGSTVYTVNNGKNGFHTYSDLTVNGGTFISYGNANANLNLEYDETLKAIPNFYVYDNSAVVLDGRAQSNKVVAGPAANKEGANIVAGKGSKVTITGGSMYADSRKINVDVTNGGEKVYLTVLDNDSDHNAFKVVSNNVYGVAAGETEYHGNRNPADIYKTIYDYLNRAGANADGKIYVWTPLADVNYYLDLDGDGEYTKADYVTENVIRGTSLAFMVGSGTLDDNMSFVANNPFIPADATFGEIPEGFFITWYDAATGEERTVFGVAGQAPDYPIYGDTDVYAELTEAPKEPEEPYFPPYQPDPKPDPKPVEPEVPDVPEEPTPVQPEEPVTPSIPDEVIDDIIDEVEQLTSVPQTGAEEEADDYAAAAVPAGVLALAVASLLRRKRRAE